MELGAAGFAQRCTRNVQPGLQGREQSEGLEGFAEAHFVGEDAAEFRAVEVPEPGDAEALVGAELVVERGFNRRGREGGKVAQGGAAGLPRLGRLKAGREFLEDRLGLGDAGGVDALGAAGGDGGGGIAGEGTLGGGELLELFGCDEVNLTAGFEVAAVGGDGFAESGVVGGAGFQADREVETAGGFGGVGDDFGGAQASGVRLEVGGEVGIEGFPETLAVGGEEIEGLVAVAEPPFARGRIEGEAGRFHEFDGAGVERVLGRGQREGEEIFGAIDKQGLGGRRIFDVRFLLGDWTQRSCGGRQSGRRRGSAEEGGVAPDAGLAVVDEDRFERGGGGEIAELGAGELDKYGGRGGAAEPLQMGKNGEQAGSGVGGRIELNLYRNGVAKDGGGEVGRENEAKHVAGNAEFRE